MRCPCRKKSETVTYAACCEPYHGGLRPAPTAEALMRSRYSAFALGKATYIDATWHPSTRPSGLTLDPREVWLSLRIVASESGAEAATVEFVARSRIGGTGRRLHEVSRFVREQDRWLYVDGQIRD